MTFHDPTSSVAPRTLLIVKSCSFAVPKQETRIAISAAGGAAFATARSEYPVNLEVLNSYVLGVIALFAVCLYVAVVATGLAELMSGTSNFRTRKKRSRNQSATRNWRNAKRSSRS